MRLVNRRSNGLQAIAPSQGSAWSEEDFRKRVQARAVELGTSVRQILIAAGVALDLLDKRPVSGRRIDTLEKLARACNWSLAELMGHDVFDRISEDLLVEAFKIAREGLRYVADAEDAMPTAVAQVYNVLADRRRDGQVIDDTVRSTLVAAIAAGFGAGRRPR
jgi:hypothetical protein